MRIYIIVVGLLFSMSVWAQEDRTMQKVQLNDGTHVVGYVAEQPGGNYLIETDAGDLFFYYKSEVARVFSYKHTSKLAYNDPFWGTAEKFGYMGGLEHGLGVNVSGYPFLSYSLINGYRFCSSHYMGLKVGFAGSVNEYTSVPVCLYYMYETTPLYKIAVYFDVSLGLIFGDQFCDRALDRNAIGFSSEITCGVRSKLKKNPDRAMMYGLGAGVSYGQGYMCFKIGYSF